MEDFGFIAPHVMKATLLLLTLSRKSLGRDDPSEEDDKKQWKCWLDNLPKQQEMQVVPCFKLKGFGEVKEVQLHLFSDTSRQWYPAVIYLHLKDVTNQVHCAFVMGKARWGLINEISISRLELTVQCYLPKALQNYSRTIGHDSRSSFLLDWLSFRVEVHQLC